MRSVSAILIVSSFWMGSINPVFAQASRLWGSYYGGTGDDRSYCVSTDASGNVYITGVTNSVAGIASPGGFQTVYGGGVKGDAYLAKFDAAGNRLWATYYGGADIDEGFSVATDASGNVYLAGFTESTINISSGGFQNTFGGNQDAFLVKFDAAGNRLWATYYGGSGSDAGYGVTVDGSGNVYLTGMTDSPSSISSGGFQNTCGGSTDAFLVKFDPAGNRLWATYYGGPGSDGSYTVTADASGNIYFGGVTNSASAIASGGFQNTLGGGSDNFAVKFDGTGNRIWGTYYGGTGNEFYGSIAVDVFGNVFHSGYSTSASGIAAGGFQNSYGGGGTGDAYLVKFDAAGSRLWGTYYGGSANEEAYADALATDASGNVYFTGDTYTPGSALSLNGYQASLTGTENIFLAKFDPAGNRICATYYGQMHDEWGSVALDNSGNVYLAGFTPSVSGIASGGFQNSYGGGGSDAFFVKLTSCTTVLSVIAASTNVLCNGQCTGTATATAANGTPPYLYSWSNGQTTSSATGLCAGSYTATVTDATPTTVTSVVTVTQPAILTATLSSTNPGCSGGNGSATISAGGGTPSYSYLWSPGGATASAVSGLGSGTYSATVTDANGCTLVQTCTVTSFPSFSLNITSTQALCASASGTATAVVSGGTSPFTYSWNNGQTTQNVTGLPAGNYSCMVTDGNGCTQISSTTIASSNGPTATISGNITIQEGDSTSLNAGGGISYSWSPSTGLSNSSIANPVAAPSASTVYCVFVYDTSGCYDSACVMVIVVPEPVVCGEFYIPNAFSPNEDDENDVFKAFINPVCVKEFRLSVYNRWGEKVFETYDVKEPWDGNYRGLASNPGVYAFYCTAVLTNGKEINKEGNVSLLR